MKRIKGMQSILNKNCNSHSRNFHLNSIRPAKHLDTEVTVTSTQSNHDSTSTAPIDYSDILRGNQEEREAALHQLRNQPAYLARYRSLDPSSRSGTGKGRLSAADGGHATATATAGRSHQSQVINHSTQTFYSFQSFFNSFIFFFFSLKLNSTTDGKGERGLGLRRWGEFKRWSSHSSGFLRTTTRGSVKREQCSEWSYW